MKKLLVALFIFAAGTTVAAQERDGGSINTARELYASARYDEALAVLNNLRPSDNVPDERKTIEQYRSLCLLALGRGTEAESAIAAVVTADPFFLPTESEASPRVRAAFTDVRTRLLPDIAATMYAAAKQAYDRKEHAVAERRFRTLITLLEDPQMNGRMGDMRTIATGFLDLAAAAAAPPPEPKKVEPPPPAPVTPPPAPAKPAEPRIYVGDEPGIVGPVTIRQNFPSIPTNIATMTKERGLIEVVIDEQGRVMTVTLRNAIHPVYDALLLNAVREWKYRPATFNGTPVRFRKLIQITLPRR